MNGMVSGRSAIRGFSLVELILSVAIMALLGTVVLRVFLTADGTNRRAANLDKAVNLAVDAVERMKAENPSILWSAENLSRIFPDSQIEPHEGGWRIQILFDEGWNMFAEARSDWPAHRMILILKPNPETGMRTTATSVVVSEMDNAFGSAFQERRIEDSKTSIYTLQAELPSACDTRGVAP